MNTCFIIFMTVLLIFYSILFKKCLSDLLPENCNQELILYIGKTELLQVLNDALKCIYMSKSPYGNPYVKLFSREYRYNHFLDLKKDFNKHFSYIYNFTDCYAGYCGPWEEQIWKSKFENAPFETFGPFVPLFIPYVLLWNNNYKNYWKELKYVFSKLKKNILYITLSQNDDGIEGTNKHVNIPPNLFIISGGGKGHIPTMLYIGDLQVSPLKERCDFKYHYCFAGSIKGRENRPEIVEFFNNKYGINNKFISTMAKNEEWKKLFETCKIILSPRGYGRNSFRLNEVFQMGFINYYISNEIWIPYEDTWLQKEHLFFASKLADMENITNFIDTMSCTEYKEIRRKIIAHIPTHFSKDGFFNQISLFMQFGFSVSDLRCSHYYTYH